jgi:thiamine pyrophosphokinase
MKKRVVIVCNGSLDTYVIREITTEDIVIGVDRAAYWLLSNGITPNVAIGDFDSATDEEKEHIRSAVKDTRAYIPEKDFTDTELALEVAFEQSPKEILIVGGAGTRMDHELATLSLLERGMKKKIPITFKTETSEITLVSRCRTIVNKRGWASYISLIPYSQKIVVSLVGFKYPLDHATIMRGQTIGISNEFLADSATITVHAGIALVIQSTD